MSQKLFDSALRRAILQGGGEQLRQAAEALLTNASSGVPWALQILADRLDGKPQQSVEVKREKGLQELSLDELRNRITELLGGTGQPDSSAKESGAVH